jgi:hypothetical protein
MYRFSTSSFAVSGLGLAIALAISPPSIAQSDTGTDAGNAPSGDQPGMGGGMQDEHTPVDAQPSGEGAEQAPPPDTSSPDDTTKKNERPPDPD